MSLYEALGDYLTEGRFKEPYSFCDYCREVGLVVGVKCPRCGCELMPPPVNA